MQSPESSSFFLVCASVGKLFFADDMGHCAESAIPTKEKILSTKLIDQTDEFAIITSDFVLAVYKISTDGKLVPENELKISTPGFNDAQRVKICWIDDGGIIALSSGTSKIRIIDVVNEESTTLICGDGIVFFLSFHNTKFSKNIFCGIYPFLLLLFDLKFFPKAASSSGMIFQWKYHTHAKKTKSKTESDLLGQRWTAVPKIRLSEIPDSVQWGSSGSSFIVVSKESVKVFEEEKVCCATFQGYCVLQLSPSVLRIFKGEAILEIDVQEKVTSVAISNSVFVVAAGFSLQVFEFPEEARLICVDGQVVLAATKQTVDIFSVTGALKGTITVGNRDGTIKFLSSANNVLTIVGSNFQRYSETLRSHKERTALHNLEVFTVRVICFFSLLPPEEIAECLCSRDSVPPLKVIQQVTMNKSGTMVAYAGIAEDEANASIVVKSAPDFIGVEKPDAAVVSAIIEFCYQVDIDNVDAAMKALSRLENDSVWRNLAKICVKKRRIDVAASCLANIRHAKAVGALRRRTDIEDSVDLKAAVLASFLDMREEVEAIYLKLKRYDLLNLYYQETGRWDEALEIASSNDRINLKTTYVKFGRYLMEIGDKSGAIAAFEKGSAICTQVPQQIFGSETEMKSYAIDSRDKVSVKKWWAQYEESRGNMNDAFKFYEESGDILSIVRLHCSTGRIGKAVEVASRSGNRAAAYHIARHFERENKVAEAIDFYAQAQCHTQAIRLAKENNLINALINLALQGTKQAMLDVAHYLERSEANVDKAITLYHRAGQTSKAVDLCFATNELHLLEELDILHKCARFFMDNDKFEEAVALLTTAKQFRDALSLCIAKNITLTEELVDKLGGSSEDGEVSADFLTKVAELCLQQKSYHLACKKFSQAGDNIKAIKSLMKSGDVERIIFFAGVSGPKQKEIYVIAANFLQTLDWRSNANIMKAIIQFYTKARAFDSLSAFYESCCQVEIDEYQNYEKALGALKEAAKVFSKAKESESTAERMHNFARRIACLETFVTARSSSDPNQIMGVCEQLLREKRIESAVRVGDIYALMIETLYSHGNMAKARDLLQEMQSRVSMNLDYYLDASILRSLRNSDSSTPQKALNSARDDEIEEDF
ncbi:hypothetical protein HDU82_006824 [Entophlyctis luteolus]|nr:hypothetical protein HDU82_006824 [Entophlyctis luteolus]